MNKKQAIKFFAKYIQISCPYCQAKSGFLCQSTAVWVHAERFVKYEALHSQD